MRNLKAALAIENVGLSSPAFENPEVTAMAAITALLRELPDDEARLRVMRWSFSRFSAEFKRPLPDGEPAGTSVAPARQPVATAAPTASAAPANTDFATQVSELSDLFGSGPASAAATREGVAREFQEFVGSLRNREESDQDSGAVRQAVRQ